MGECCKSGPRRVDGLVTFSAVREGKFLTTTVLAESIFAVTEAAGGANGITLTDGKGKHEILGLVGCPSDVISDWSNGLRDLGIAGLNDHCVKTLPDTEANREAKAEADRMLRDEILR